MTTDPLEADDFYNYLEHQTFKLGELMPLQTDSHWLLEQGIVKTSTWTEGGTPITFGYWSQNDLIGKPVSSIYPYQIKCLTTVVAKNIPNERTDKFPEQILAQVRQTEEILHILRGEKADRRLRQVLIWLCRKFGRDVATGKLIQLRLTHQDLGESIGATRVTITKIVNQLEQEGFLSRPQRNSIIINRQHCRFED